MPACWRSREEIRFTTDLSDEADSHALWIQAVLIFSGLAILNVEDDQNDRADDRDQADQDPPAGAAGVIMLDLLRYGVGCMLSSV
jgi:hypothetical protein